jgi:hypothetical protein
LDVDKIIDEERSLKRLNIFSDDQLDKLREYSIFTADQFVGLCATPEGFNGVKSALGLTQTSLNNIIIQVKRQLPSDLAKLLNKPSTITPPLGARKPRKSRKTRKTKKKN